MKLNNTVVTLALLGVLALAALAGGLLPAGNVIRAQAANAPPVFSGLDASLDVDENTPAGVNIGDPYTATDPDEATLEFGDSLTYSLEGDDAASFEIDPLTGQISTKAPLDYENPRGGTNSDSNGYLVTVKVEDSGGGTDAIEDATFDVSINVMDIDEPPAAPHAPTVVSGEDDDPSDQDELSTTTLKVVWHPPVNTGRNDITGYEVQYKKSSDPTFTDGTHSGTDTTTTINPQGGLEPGTSYQVRVRASINADDGPWSLVGTGSTNKVGTRAPSFEQTGPYTLNVPENSSAGQVVGVAVTADDADSRTLSYRFDGRDADLFDFNTSSGQIRTKRNVDYNHEDPKCSYVQFGQTKCTYFVTVVAFDRTGGSDALRVSIDVTDRTERPSAPAKPTVLPKANSRTSLDVKWSEPANTGPAITAYNVEYRPKGSTSDFSDDGIPETVAGTSTTISGGPSNNEFWLAAGTSYEVRVRAVSDEGTSEWSPVGTGNTNAGNREPVFRDRNTDENPVGTDASTTREVNENTDSSRPIGRAVVADDGDGDKRTYKLVPADANDAASVAVAGKFDINEDSGQILTEASLTHEDDDCDYDDVNDDPTMCTYTVKVEVGDGLDANRNEEEVIAADDTITVVITVKDLPEPPSTPTVTVTSPVDVTTLAVTWEAENTGPDITGYDLRYREGSRPYSTDNCGETGTDNCSSIAADTTTTTITGLTANTSYSVEVRARNAEGTSSWASAGAQRTNRNKEVNIPNSVPEFSAVTPLTVNESEQSRQEVGSVLASDQDGGTLRYTLEGPHKNLFTIGSTTGLIQTSSKLDHEDPACGYDSADDDADDQDPQTSCTYSVRVKVVDGQGGSASAVVTITVADQPEPPSAPSTPRVAATSGSGKSLDVTWNEPSNTGPSINDYDIQYREVGGSDDDWLDWAHEITERKARITDLDPRKTYEVEVQATNFEGTSAWSSAGRGTTNASNIRPTFDDTATVVVLSVDENTGAGRPVGSPVSASDNDGNRLTYSLEGPGAAKFTILSSGQIRTRSLLNHEAEECYYEDGTGSFCRYSVTVKVDDGQRKGNSSAAKSVTIDVVDVAELPSVPRPPTVMGVPGSTDSVRVTWDEPANTGPPITDYDVQYGVAGTGGFSTWTHQGVDGSTIITALTSGTRYEVRVRAMNDEGTSEYSRSGTGSPNPDVANRNPGFSGGSRTFSVAENTGPGDPIGSPVDASDPDDDPLTYELEGADAASFDIDSGSGQIRTSAELNHEEKSRYSVTVRARDGRGGTSTVGVTINVTDVDEPPSAPSSPTVTEASSSSLQVTWDAPENTGPSITDYDYRYKALSDSLWTEVTNTTIRVTTVTISRLTASTFYDVEVRATNAEGTSEWSNPGIGSTAAPGANSPPVFSEGTSAERSVSASASAGTSIEQPVRATDADSGDTLTYSLEGRDAASFGINSANGQLSTIAGVTLVAGTTYEVTVVASDGRDIARIAVSIEATTGPPNNVPVFSEGASATRSVARSAAAGTAIGQPVRAADADPGATVNYTLEGADAASFDIRSTTAGGQLLTRSGVTLDQSSYTVEVVASDGTDSARITVTINVVLNRAPVFSGGARSFTVRDNASAGTSIGSVTATDSDAGDTVTYSLEGTGGASFDIVSTSGLIRTRAGVTLTAGATHSVTVVATDRNAGRATVAVTITVIQGSFGCGTNGAVDSSNSGLVDDCEALLRARDRLQDGGARLNWFERTPIDRWQGITLGGTPLRVTEVDLNRMGLSGTVPADLGDVDRLTKLNLRSNDLSGAIPASLGNLRYLEVLNLHSNMLNGAIPNLSGTVLQELYLTNNVRWNRDADGERISRVQGTGLSGGVPAWLNTMTDLRELWLWGNNLEGTMPDLSRMRSLDKLKLSGNTGLTGFSGAKLPSGLRWLVASETDVGATAPDLSGMTSMTTLWLNKTGLSGAIPVASIPTSVSNLNLKDNSLRTIPDMSDLDNLRYLYLHRNDLRGVIPGTLGDMASIERIWLHENELTGIADGFRNASDTLTHLYLAGNNFDAGTCLPGDLAMVERNDFADAGLEACQ